MKRKITFTITITKEEYDACHRMMDVDGLLQRKIQQAYRALYYQMREAVTGEVEGKI